MRRSMLMSLVVPIGILAACLRPGSNATPKQEAPARARAAHEQGRWSEAEIAAVAAAAEQAATDALLVVINQKFDVEKTLSPQRRELVIAAMHVIAGTIESRKSLLPMEGEKTWLEESQIQGIVDKRGVMDKPGVVDKLQNLKELFVPDGTGGAVALPLRWGKQHKGFAEVAKEWVREALERLRKREAEGVFRRVPLNFDPGLSHAPGVEGLEAALGDYATLFNTIDPLEGTDYEVDLKSMLVSNAGKRRTDIRVYLKAALLRELLGGEVVTSVYGTRSADPRSKKVVQNAPPTCATHDRDTAPSGFLPRFRDPKPLIWRIAEKAHGKSGTIGDFPEQQFCFGLVQHLIESLALGGK